MTSTPINWTKSTQKLKEHIDMLVLHSIGIRTITISRKDFDILHASMDDDYKKMYKDAIPYGNHELKRQK